MDIKFEHECNDWDYMIINEFDYEFTNCHCFEVKDSAPQFLRKQAMEVRAYQDEWERAWELDEDIWGGSRFDVSIF